MRITLVPARANEIACDTPKAVRECREALDCGGLTPLWLCAGRMLRLRNASSGEKALRLAAEAAVTLIVCPAADGKAASSRRSPKARATLHAALHSITALRSGRAGRVEI